MKKLYSLLACLALAILVFGSSGCAGNPPPCTVSTPGVEKLTIQFVCPRVGASYETVVLKCPGDETFRVDVACQLCGRHHRYPVTYWPYDYWMNGYYFYGGWFYPANYWRSYWWPYYYHRPYTWHRSHVIERPVPGRAGVRTPPALPRPSGHSGQAPPPPPPQKAVPSPPSHK